MKRERFVIGILSATLCLMMLTAFALQPPAVGAEGQSCDTLHDCNDGASCSGEATVILCKIYCGGVGGGPEIDCGNASPE